MLMLKIKLKYVYIILFFNCCFSDDYLIYVVNEFVVFRF